MNRTHRGAYQRRVLSIEDTAQEQQVPRELRESFHRLLRSMCGVDNEKRRKLDTLLDSLYAKPKCQLDLVFTACHQACSAALYERLRAQARNEAREVMEKQVLLWKQLKHKHGDFQRLLKQPTFPAPPNLTKRAQQSSKDFLALLPYLAISVSSVRLPKRGRPPLEKWRSLAHKMLKAARVPSRDETHLRKLLGF